MGAAGFSIGSRWKIARRLLLTTYCDGSDRNGKRAQNILDR